MRTIIQTVMLTFCFFSVSAAAQIPDNDYICKVQTVGVRLGVVFVQSDTRAIAAEIASTAMALTVAGEEELAQSTLECIASTGESFQDKEFDRFVRSLPR
jgi:hypothetical protein